MKVILSRKGFDSGYGGWASPILPDGRMLSLPIPAANGVVSYEDLSGGDVSYLDIMHQLRHGREDKLVLSYKTWLPPEPRIMAHLDPDLVASAVERLPGLGSSPCPYAGVLFGFSRLPETDGDGGTSSSDRAPGPNGRCSTICSMLTIPVPMLCPRIGSWCETSRFHPFRYITENVDTKAPFLDTLRRHVYCIDMSIERSPWDRK